MIKNPVKDVEAEVDNDEVVPYAVVEEKPLFQGTKDASEFTKWVYDNLEYPKVAKENAIQGRVTVEFIIDKDGFTKDIKVIRGVDSSLDKTAVELLRKAPQWSPGKQKGKPVKVSYTFPIIFKCR